MAEKKSVDVFIGLQKLSLRTDQNPDEVHAAAELVNRRLNEVLPYGQPLSHQILLLVAMTLADEFLHMQSGLDSFKGQIRERSERLLARLDEEFPTS